jgi:hypothetical protein
MSYSTLCDEFSRLNAEVIEILPQGTSASDMEVERRLNLMRELLKEMDMEVRMLDGTYKKMFVVQSWVYLYLYFVASVRRQGTESQKQLKEEFVELQNQVKLQQNQKNRDALIGDASARSRQKMGDTALRYYYY